MPGPRSVAKGGTRGTWKVDMATTTLSASQLRSPAATTNLPSSLPEPVHADAGPDRELEPGRVGLQVVGHLVLGRGTSGPARGTGARPARRSGPG